MEEKIGKVILDTTCYPGKDLYSDGAIEDGNACNFQRFCTGRI